MNITVKLLVYRLITIILLLGASMAIAGDVEKGKDKSTACAVCHGQYGVSAVPIYPNLMGQNEQYLVSAITAY